MVNIITCFMARRRKGAAGKGAEKRPSSASKKSNGSVKGRLNGALTPDESQDDDSSLLSCEDESGVPPEHIHKKFGRKSLHMDNGNDAAGVSRDGNSWEEDGEERVVEETMICEDMQLDVIEEDMVITGNGSGSEDLAQMLDLQKLNHATAKEDTLGQRIMDIKNLVLENGDVDCDGEYLPEKQKTFNESGKRFQPVDSECKGEVALVLSIDDNPRKYSASSEACSQITIENVLCSEEKEYIHENNLPLSGSHVAHKSDNKACMTRVASKPVQTFRSRKTRSRSECVGKSRRKENISGVGTDECEKTDVKFMDCQEDSCASSGSDILYSKSTRSDSLKIPVPISSPQSPHVSRSESESSIPVKLKSRWRRSSEMESLSGGNRSSDSEITATPPTPCFSPKPGTPTNPASPPSLQSIDPPIPTTSSEDRKTDIDEMEEKLRSFIPIVDCEYLTHRSSNKETKRMVCDCFLTKEELQRGEMGCGEDCLNRLLMIECGSRCPVGERCSNKRFQRCEYGKCEVFRTEKKGFGLRALEDLPNNTFILEYVGEVLDPKEFRRRAKDYAKVKNRHYYFMALKSDAIIDATQKGNISRFINHSCDPNAETQKWTVNGELRIGFFTKRFVSAGQEITFDYQLQRYGKEAQRCFCESAHCRGWIGDDPEKEKRDRKERKERELKKKKEEKRRDFREMLDDMDLEEEIEKLSASGLKNRAHTLNLCRLMVRAQDFQSRSQLLKLLREGEPACRRLFLDYHGLRLIWSWMMDLGSVGDNRVDIKIEILQALSKLPIPNKTVLQDSKVLAVVEKWAESPRLDRKLSVDSSASNTPQRDGDKKDGEQTSGDEPRSDAVLPSVEVPDEDTKEGIENEKQLVDLGPKQYDVTEQQSLPVKVVKPSECESESKEDPAECKEDDDSKLVKDEHEAKSESFLKFAASLLTEWLSLKEVFRIPKKERIEQMKEHEREADRGYKEYLDKEENQNKQSYDRHRRRIEHDRARERKRLRESPDSERNRKGSRYEDRTIIPVPKISKEERRQLFEMKVAQEEEEERQRKQQQELWRQHEERCLALGIDPQVAVEYDPQTGYPLFFDPATGTWQPYPPPDGNTMPGDIGPSPVFNPANPLAPPSVIQNNHHVTTPQTVPFNSANLIHAGVPPGSYSETGSVHAEPLLPEYIPLPSGPHPHLPQSVPTVTQAYPIGPQPVPAGPQSHVTSPLPVGTPHLSQPVYQQTPSHYSQPIAYIAAPPMPPARLPPKWKSAKDSEGRVYYYHVKTRISQWEPPPWPEGGEQQDTDTSSDSSDDDDEDEDDDDSSSSEDEDDDDDDEDKGDDDDDYDDDDDDLLDDKQTYSFDIGGASELGEPSTSGVGDIPLPVPVQPEDVRRKEKRREGLVQERIISPRREEDRQDTKLYQENKEKLRRRKELAQSLDKEHPKKRHREKKSRSKSEKTGGKILTEAERKIRDQFRLKMAGSIVQYLNPYRKSDCKAGRISTTEDFKYLARKLTHHVMHKELSHLRSVKDLECNDNVKHKAREFVKKYMAKFGSTYVRDD